MLNYMANKKTTWSFTICGIKETSYAQVTPYISAIYYGDHIFQFKIAQFDDKLACINIYGESE